jgi:hypothetical protein
VLLVGAVVAVVVGLVPCPCTTTLSPTYNGYAFLVVCRYIVHILSHRRMIVSYVKVDPNRPLLWAFSMVNCKSDDTENDNDDGIVLSPFIVVVVVFFFIFDIDVFAFVPEATLSSSSSLLLLLLQFCVIAAFMIGLSVYVFIAMDVCSMMMMMIMIMLMMLMMIMIMLMMLMNVFLCFEQSYFVFDGVEKGNSHLEQYYMVMTLHHFGIR